MTALTAIRQPKTATAPEAAHELNGVLHVLTCGSVDDGKSTLIGRLLWDASDLYDDQRETLKRSSDAPPAAARIPISACCVDGLVAEREQGITIDIAWRYFDTDTRRFVIIDSPGHEQYTRNMASGASHADVAIMLVDARHGVKRQTRRHAAILDIVGVKRVDPRRQQDGPRRLVAGEIPRHRGRLPRADAALRLPRRDRHSGLRRLAATTSPGTPSTCPGTRGRTCSSTWSAFPRAISRRRGPFRLPVQTVLRDGLDFRGLAGTVGSGRICVGDRVTDALSGQSAHVLRIATMGRDLELAQQGQAVALQLDTDIDVARGAVLSTPDSQPTVATQRRGAPRVVVGDTVRSARRLPVAHGDRPGPNLVDQDQVAARPGDARGAAGGGRLRQRHRHRRDHARSPRRRRCLRRRPPVREHS